MKFIFGAILVGSIFALLFLLEGFFPRSLVAIAP